MKLRVAALASLWLVLGLVPGVARELPITERLASQIDGCLVIPDEAAGYRYSFTLEFTTDRAGKISSELKLIRSKSPLIRTVVEAAKRALIACAPYPFVPDETVRINFEP